MKKLLCRGILLILLMIILSCKKESGSGSIEYNSMPPFHEVVMKGVFHVYLKQDSFFSVRIAGRPDYIDGVKLTHDNGTLTFYNESRWMWLRPEDNDVELHITADRLKKVSSHETCLIETINPIITDEFGIELGYKYNEANLELDCHTFYYWNNFPCGGRLTLTGQTRELKLWNYALMSVDAGQLLAGYALVENHSKGDCRVRVQDLLDYSIHGEGNIYLYGTTGQVKENEITGSGRLIRIEEN